MAKIWSFLNSLSALEKNEYSAIIVLCFIKVNSIKVFVSLTQIFYSYTNNIYDSNIS